MRRLRLHAAALVVAALVLGMVGPAGAHGEESGDSKPANHADHAGKAKKSKKAKKAAEQAKKSKKAKKAKKAGKSGHEHAAKPAADDKGLSLLVNGHHHEIGTEHALTRTERAALRAQIEGTIEAANRFPTVAAAKAAGYVQTGPYLPGIGAHFINIGGKGFNVDGRMDPEDLANPLAIIYDATDDAAQVAGFMYYSMAKDEPEGFVGDNDVWHFHENLCLKMGGPKGIEVPYGLDHAATKKQCEAVGGQLMPQTQWMVHVWSVPGWESRQGLFGEVNPALMCPDGTYYQRKPEQWAAHPDNACISAS